MTQQVVHPHPVLAARPSTRFQVMVVDDDPHFRSLVRSLLESGGVTVIEAGDSQEGMHCMHCREIELIVLDVVLPGVDGLKTLHALKSAFPRTKVVIVTALYIQHTVPLDADAVLCKSDVERLPLLVEQLLDGTK
jgi:CheY-like chemotaxis protein